MADDDKIAGVRMVTNFIRDDPGDECSFTPNSSLATGGCELRKQLPSSFVQSLTDFPGHVEVRLKPQGPGDVLKERSFN